MAAIRQVDALDKSKFLELFEGAIDSNQTYARMFAAGNVVQFERAEGAATVGDDFNQGSTRSRKSISVILKEGEPVFGQWMLSLIMIIIFNIITENINQTGSESGALSRWINQIYGRGWGIRVAVGRVYSHTWQHLRA